MHQASPPIAADPFAFWPALASRVTGLGGTRVGTRADDDPAYAFHTAYHALPAGPVRGGLRFRGLTASAGSLVVRVNALAEDGTAETIHSHTFRAGELARDGGAASVTFEAAEGVRYAMLGHLYEGEASADALSVTLEPLPPADAALAAARAALPARPVFRRAAALLSDAPATLADPVSQTCTAAQFDEPAYDGWLPRLKVERHRHRKQWEFVYILQALERYGALREDARGLGFGVGREPLPAVMAAAGATVVATDLAAGDPRAAAWAGTDQHGGLEALRRSEIVDDALFNERVSFRAADMNRLPDDLAGFDFAWSSCAMEHLGSIRAGIKFVLRSVECLVPGGLAVHTTELNCLSDGDTLADGGTVLFRRRDLDRLAIELVSRGHGVAQLKYDLGGLPDDRHVDVAPYAADPHLKLALGGYVTTSFGLIVRRGG